MSLDAHSTSPACWRATIPLTPLAAADRHVVRTLLCSNIIRTSCDHYCGRLCGLPKFSGQHGKAKMKDEHNKAAEHHESAAKSHRAAAEAHGRDDHTKGKEHSAQAQQHAQNASDHSKTAHAKSTQQQQK
jgi:hypothetical protein